MTIFKMERQTVRERILEVQDELNISKHKLSKMFGPGRYLEVICSEKSPQKGVHLRSIEKWSERLDRIPLVLYGSGGQPEDLDHPEFKEGIEVPNYVGKVFRKTREERGLTPKELEFLRAQMNGEEFTPYEMTYGKGHHRTWEYRLIEKGDRKIGSTLLESYCDLLGLTPLYFAPKDSTRFVISYHINGSNEDLQLLHLFHDDLWAEVIWGKRNRLHFTENPFTTENFSDFEEDLRRDNPGVEDRVEVKVGEIQVTAQGFVLDKTEYDLMMAMAKEKYVPQILQV